MKRHYCNIIANIRRTIDSNYVLKTRALRQIPALVTWATEATHCSSWHLIGAALTQLLFLACKFPLLKCLLRENSRQGSNK